MGSFSSFLGFKSENYFGLVASGKRNLTVESIHTIATALNLTYEETERFEVMVLLSQAASVEERRFYKTRLDQLVEKKPTPAARFSPRQLVTSWQPLAILIGADRVSADQVVEKCFSSWRTFANSFPTAPLAPKIAYFNSPSTFAVSRSLVSSKDQLTFDGFLKLQSDRNAWRDVLQLLRKLPNE